MYKLTCMFLLAAMVVAGAEKYKTNKQTDRNFEMTNNVLRKAGTTSAPLPVIEIDPKVSYSNATYLGLDSLYRTGDCWIYEEKNSAKVETHYGMRLLKLNFPHLIIDGVPMSGYVRIRDNSMVLIYTMKTDNGCSVELNDFRVERLAKVEFGASRADFDGTNQDAFFQDVVVPAINGILKSKWTAIEQSFQAMCKQPTSQHGTYLQATATRFLNNNLM